MTTPFDDLPPLPEHTPDAAFANALLRRVRAELVVDHIADARSASASADSSPPSDSPRSKRAVMPHRQIITPYLSVADGNAALEWYRNYFRASVSNIIEWEGGVGHSELEFSGAVFYLSDAYPAIGVVAPNSQGPGSSAAYVVLVADADAFIDRAVAGGATLQRPIEEAHGTRSGWIVDPFGHRWNIGTPLRGGNDGSETQPRRRPAEPYYLTVATPDVDRAAEFYRAVLDWELTEPNPEGGRHVANTKQPIGIRPLVMSFDTRMPGEITMWWIVRDFDDALDRVRTAGGSVDKVTSYDSGREAICVDDQGVRFSLSEPSPGYDPDNVSRPNT